MIIMYTLFAIIATNTDLGWSTWGTIFLKINEIFSIYVPGLKLYIFFSFCSAIPQFNKSGYKLRAKSK